MRGPTAAWRRFARVIVDGKPEVLRRGPGFIPR
jgi:hypothetical protein